MSQMPGTSEPEDIQRLPMNCEEYNHLKWNFKYKKSHILHSQCTTGDKCKNSDEMCQFCLYSNTLELTHFPEMIFPNNVLTLAHECGPQIEFTALDALLPVKNSKLDIEVAHADVWRESRDPSHLEEKLKPFDWTFTTDYRGTCTGPIVIEPTMERIDIDRLRQKEQILFYQDLMLFEDELHDNGIASCTVKIRAMPSSFFVLLRYFLRVDNVLVRINDTRYFHDFTTEHVLREYTNRECSVKNLRLPMRMFGDPNALSPHVPLCTSVYEKISWPQGEEDEEVELRD